MKDVKTIARAALSMRRNALILWALASCGCGEQPQQQPEVKPPVPSEATAGPSAALPAPSATGSASSAAAETTITWLGVALDPSIELAQQASFKGSQFRFPSNYRQTELDNGMSENTIGLMAFLPAPRKGTEVPFGQTPKSAILMLVSHAAVHDSLLEYGAGQFFAISAGVGEERWERPSLVQVGPERRDATLLRGSGKLGTRPVELWQLRCKYPTKGGEGDTTLWLGVFDSAAPKEARAAFLASFASFVPRP